MFIAASPLPAILPPSSCHPLPAPCCGNGRSVSRSLVLRLTPVKRLCFQCRNNWREIMPGTLVSRKGFISLIPICIFYIYSQFVCSALPPHMSHPQMSVHQSLYLCGGLGRTLWYIWYLNIKDQLSSHKNFVKVIMKAWLPGDSV